MYYAVDKPSKEELTELLCDLSVPGNNWEHFASFLPNMTPQIIGDIKLRDPDNPMHGVAQHWYKQKQTWNQVIDLLKKANEVGLADRVKKEILKGKLLDLWCNYICHN